MENSDHPMPHCRLLRRKHGIPSLLFWDFKRIILPRIGLLILGPSNPFSRFLVSFLKRVSLWGDLYRVLPKTDKGIDFLRTDLKSELIQYACKYRFIKHKIYVVFPL
jgi:hypothetical protein